jgi:hypothetical protein
MSALVGIGSATWEEFVASAFISLAATVGVAVVASRIYQRAVLKTGSRVKIGDLVFGRASRRSFSK